MKYTQAKACEGHKSSDQIMEPIVILRWENDGVVDNEWLSFVWELQLVRPFLEYEQLTICKDHQAFKKLLKGAGISGRLAHWRFRPSELTFLVQYEKGLKNTIEDALKWLRTKGIDTSSIYDEIQTFFLEKVEQDE